MIETYESTFTARVIFALLFFSAFLAYDLLRHGSDSPRLREYAFLVLAMLLAVGYGVVHDHITATISPPYFLIGKGLADDPRPFRWAVTILAIRATYGVGLLVGAFLLIANNPSRLRPQLPFKDLIRLSVFPLGFAATGAAICGILFVTAPFGLRAIGGDIAGEAGVTRFLITWGIHCGSYAGGVLGAILAVVCVVRARRRLAANIPKSNGQHAAVAVRVSDAT